MVLIADESIEMLMFKIANPKSKRAKAVTKSTKDIDEGLKDKIRKYNVQEFKEAVSDAATTLCFSRY